jgi:hypothetical protein
MQQDIILLSSNVILDGVVTLTEHLHPLFAKPDAS